MRPYPPNPVKVGRRSVQVAWPIMQTTKYVEQAESHMNALEKSLRWLLDSIPMHEGDDNLTEPIALAESLLGSAKAAGQ
jgi:hypothetical protein